MSSFESYKPEAVGRNASNVDWASNIMLISSDESEKGYLVSKEAKKLSPFFEQLIESDERCIIPVKGLANSTIQYVAWYLAYFADNEEEPRGDRLPKPFPDDHYCEGQLTNFEKHFADTLFPKPGATDLRVITGLLHATQFLQVQPLMDMTGCALTFHFRLKTPQEIKDLMANQIPEYTVAPPTEE